MIVGIHVNIRRPPKLAPIAETRRAEARRALAAMGAPITVYARGDISPPSRATSSASRVCASEIARQLKQDPMAPVVVKIDSSGGFVDETWRILDALGSHKGAVNTQVIGQCHSAATAILTAGIRRDAPIGARFLIHLPALSRQDVARFDGKRYTAENIHFIADGVAANSDRLAALYASVTSMPAHWWRREMAAEKHMPVYAAATLGLVTSIGGRESIAKAARRSAEATGRRFG